ncbi:MAG: hypothetical protein JXQ75_12450 [Phycisphaerae bacterium]|nr:hypothetical protein [Phycisphaerae bacterium]
MSSLRNLVLLPLLVAVCTTFVLTPAVRADGANDVLKLVPEDAWGFVLARSLNTIDEKAKLLQESLIPWIPAQVTPMALGPLNLGDTLDMTRPICIVIMDVTKFGGPNNAGVILVPSKDPKALLEKLLAEEPQEGICKCTVMGQAGYAAVKDKTVIMGSSQECVTKVVKAEKTIAEGLDKARAAAIEKSDLCISISLAAVLDAYKDMISGFLQMASAASTGKPENKDVDNFIKLLSQMDAVDISLRLNKDGLSLAIVTTPKKDSDFEKLLRDTKNSEDSLLKVLPKEKYLIALGGTSLYSEHSEKFTGGAGLSDKLKMLQLEGLNEEALKTIDSQVKDLAKASGAWAVGASALAGGADGMLGLTIVVKAKDPKDYVAGIRKVYKAMTEASDNEDFEKIKKNVVHAEDAETIAGKKVDTITVNLEGLADVIELSKDDLKQVTKVLGKDITLRFGAVGKTHVLFTFGGGKARFEKVCETLESSGQGLSADAGITKISGRLTSPRASECYIAVDNILQLVRSIAKEVGEEDVFPFDVPTVDAPVAISAAQIGRVQQMDIIIPMKLMTEAKQFIETMSKQGFEDFDEDEDADADQDADADSDKDADEDEDLDEEDGE